MIIINSSKAYPITAGDKTASLHYHTIESDGGVPIGAFTWWFGLSTKIPYNWLICNGQKIPDDSKYDTLKSILNYDYVPDLINVHSRDNNISQQHSFIKAAINNQTEVNTPPWRYENAKLPKFDGDIIMTNMHTHGTAHIYDTPDTNRPIATGAYGGTANIIISYPYNSIFGKSATTNPVIPANVTAIPLIKAFD